MPLQVLKTTYKGRGKWKSTADALNKICKVINSMVGFGGITIEAVGEEIRFTGSAVGSGLSTWDVYGYLAMPGNTIRIRERAIYLHGIRTYTIVQQDVHLSGSPCWVYVRIERGMADEAAVMTQTSEPASNATYLNIALYSFTYDETTTRYSLSRSGKFDVNIDAPMR